MDIKYSFIFQSYTKNVESIFGITIKEFLKAEGSQKTKLRRYHKICFYAIHKDEKIVPQHCFDGILLFLIDMLYILLENNFRECFYPFILDLFSSFRNSYVLGGIEVFSIENGTFLLYKV